MILNLYKTEYTDCDLAQAAKLVNLFQFFFVARVVGEVITPADVHSFETEPKVLSHWFESQCKNVPDVISILITSRRLNLANWNSVYTYNGKITVISDHHWRDTPHDTIVRLTRHIIQVGMSAFGCHRSTVTSCVCNQTQDFDCLCSECEEHLDRLDYRDSIRRLKDSFNVLNQLRSAPNTSLPEQLEASHLRLATEFAEEISAEEIAAKRPLPFENLILLVVLHFLSDLIPFVNALRRLGCRYEDMYLIAKPYPYARRDEVNHYFVTQGINTIRASKEESIEECAKHVLTTVSERLKHTTPTKLLVIEDGGYFAPLLHTEVFSDLLPQCIGVVEQTQKGANNDAKIENIRVPILSVAQSNFKKIFESPEIGRVAVQNIARFTPNTKLSGEHAVLFGFGSVGQEIAFHLTNAFNMTVSVVDNKDESVLRARHRKTIVAEAASKFEDLSFKHKALLVVGSTGSGQPSVTESVLRNLRDGAVLVSTSSDREEIDVKALERMAGDRVREIAIGKDEYTIEGENGEEKKLLLLAEGYPINFYASESLPNDTIDPIMTLLMLCAIDLAFAYRRGVVLENKIMAEAVDKISQERHLFRRILDRRTPGSTKG